MIVLSVIGLGILVSQYLLILSFSRLTLSLATALTPSCVIWSVVGEFFTSGAQEAPQGIAGVAIYAVGIGSLALESSSKLSGQSPELASQVRRKKGGR